MKQVLLLGGSQDGRLVSVEDNHNHFNVVVKQPMEQLNVADLEEPIFGKIETYHQLIGNVWVEEGQRNFFINEMFNLVSDGLKVRKYKHQNELLLKSIKLSGMENVTEIISAYYHLKRLEEKDETQTNN